MTFFAVIWATAVFCAPVGDRESGAYFPPPVDQIVLANKVCSGLRHHFDLSWQSFSVFVLAHEEGHAHDPQLNPLQGPRPAAYITDPCGQEGPCEAYADCWGAGHMKRLARLFGWSFEGALRLRRIAQRGNFGYSKIPASCWR